ncbi:hypothetical protein DM39_592 [Burkholderia cenocepacia]|uniref:Alpha/beta hydrolase n=1 Tax=Burkholderia cenocepacia TaxID=95486 RepID=A0AAN0RTY9_9BURK|nr:hypothetical protein DM39_592 [Burkholderia cenocepacia]
MSESLIYEDSSVRVMYRHGKKDNLICTFGDAAAAAKYDALNYNGKSVIEHLDLCAVIFQPKGANWYPSESMCAAIKVLREVIDLSEFANIIGYGASMGGYGALKFSHLLNATHIVAYCPQWSIDPDEANGENPGFSSYFKEGMRGHGVSSSELARYENGVYLVYDPKHVIDNYHAKSYLSRGCKIVAVPLRGAGHDVPKILIGREYFSQLWDAVLAGNADCVRSIVVNKYRSSRLRYIGAFRLAARRHPRWCSKLLIDQASKYIIYDDSLDNLNIESVVDDLIRRLALQGVRSSARSLARLKAMREVVTDRVDLVIDQLLTFNEESYLLRTKFDTLLCYDEIRGNLRAYRCDDIVMKMAMPVQLRYYRENPFLSVEKYGGSKICVMTSDGRVMLREMQGLDGLEIAGYKVDISDGKVALKSMINGSYCSISPLGEVTWDRPWARSNETFELIRRK